MRTVLTCLYLCALLVTTTTLEAADSDSDNAIPKLFESEEILEVTINAPWSALVRDKNFQDPYPATIEYIDPTGKSVTHELTVERRGIKRQEACTFPPIRLRFEKSEVKGSVFRGQDSLKMVTHCEDSLRYDQYFLIEMMAYRMYNLITDYSFRVRPLSATYKDTETGNSEANRFAFVIEDDSDVAKRNGLKKLEIPRVGLTRLDETTISDFTLFQLMIGNSDWAALKGPDPEECCHNVKLAAPRPLGDNDKIWPIPYDFDSSGLVDAPYAAPPEGLGINSVSQRIYRGYCRYNETLPQARQKQLDLEAEIFAVLDSDPRVTEYTKKEVTRYLQKYFKIIKDDKDFDRATVRKCRK